MGITSLGNSDDDFFSSDVDASGIGVVRPDGTGRMLGFAGGATLLFGGLLSLGLAARSPRREAA